MHITQKKFCRQMARVVGVRASVCLCAWVKKFSGECAATWAAPPLLPQLEPLKLHHLLLLAQEEAKPVQVAGGLAETLSRHGSC
jgi:hypothetical protein